ncbi:hypothetical protein [Mycolicibacter arupensis]|uniref:Uncharacterized protein n=1 Tax=Mycolicibacter arupensis TaxID=342002 RepID=A0A5C7Y2P7_9MYCO|nr:hypothetical protein [Mycolicibacter arupensis]TXI55943.1 MAG: hypothetical protein E6Q54_12000 [Mycolicibacter arupensis]
MNRDGVRQVDALLLQAGRQRPPRAYAIDDHPAVFGGLIGAHLLHRETMTTAEGEPVVFWINNSTDERRLTHNETATQLYQKLSSVPTRAAVLGDVIVTGDEESVPLSVVRLAQRLYMRHEHALTAAMAAYTGRRIG